MKSKKNRLTKRIGIFALVVMLFCATLAFSTIASEASEVRGDVCYTVGDVNDDGSVTSKDAIKLAYSGLTQSNKAWDFNGDEEIDVRDAIHLLYSVNGLFGDLFPKLDGVVHAYGEPSWTWDLNNGTAVAVYTCACGDTVERKSADVTVEKVEATCTEDGYAKYTATVEFGGVVDTSVNEVLAKAEGHELTSRVSCEDRACKNCDYTVKAGAHNYGDPVVTEATCTEAKHKVYTCVDCEFSYEEYEGEALGHTLKELAEVEVGECEYQETLQCTVCQEKVSGETFERHTYVATIAKEATCKAAGEKVYTCSDCGDSYSETIALDANAHVWDNGVEGDTVTTYTCNNCAATRTTINAKTATSATVSTEALKEVDEVEVNNAAIKLDEATLNQLEGEVAIDVQTVDKADLGLSTEEQSQIGENPVYDFNLTSNENTVSKFEGKVTITLPYTLQEGDDADCIDVWFISDAGEITVVQGKYSNGYVTFETDHFSYYTVTRLTPKQRCEVYGCSATTRVVAPTCEEDGYTLSVCVRCGKTEQTDKVAKLGHDITKVEVAATCEKDGSTTETCSRTNCTYSRKTSIPKTGHAWNLDEKVEASCTVAGSEDYSCSNCDATNKVVYAQLAHELEHITVEATCESKGYVESKCKNCDYKSTTDKGGATGHDYTTAWSWGENEGALTATLTLTCSKDSAHTVVKEAVISISKQVSPTCEKDGKTIYNATVSHNQKVYTDTYEVVEEKFGHRESEALEFNNNKHYYTCTVCSARVNEEAHVFDDGAVLKDATCEAEGEVVYTCACGYTSKESLPVTGHDIVDGTCSNCGFKTEECTHENKHMEEVYIEPTDGFCGVWLEFEVCDCGEQRWLNQSEFGCEGEEYWEQFISDNGFYMSRMGMECENCGTHFMAENFAEVISKENCEVKYGAKITATTKDGVELANFSVTEGNPDHATNVCVDKTDMAQYGLCGGTLLELTCVCGQNKGFDIYDNECQWRYQDDLSGNGIDYNICEVCGVQQRSEWTEEELGNCQWLYHTTLSFIKDGNELVSYERNITETYHDWEETVELHGETCSEGMYVNLTCKDCGATEGYYSKPKNCEDAGFYDWQNKDVEGICGGTVELCKVKCPCGAYEREWIYTQCNTQWHHEYVNTENGFITTESRTCADCDFKQVDEYAYEVTDVACQYAGTRTNTYYFGEEVLLQSISACETHSDEYWKLISAEFYGETCEDGFKSIEECTICGETIENNWGHHRYFELETYDLADYGMCGGTVAVRGCACGLEGYIERYDDKCDWTHWYYDEETGTSTYKCLDCGAMWQRQEEVSLDGCQGTRTTRFEYQKGYNVVLTVEYTGQYEEHDATYTFALDVEGGVCSDGYTVYETCKRCGNQDSWQNKPDEGEHWTYPVERYELSEYGYCGGYITKVVCPCGEEERWSREIWEWCDWSWYQYDEATDTTWFKCRECGNLRSEQAVEMATEGCERYMETTYVFCDTERNELFRFVAEETWTEHDSTYTFVLDVEGGTCSDGFMVTESCRTCGETNTWHNKPVEGEHPTYEVTRYDLTEYGFCGGSVGYGVCPCGAENYRFYDGEVCDWRHIGYEESDGVMMRQLSCANCGNTRVDVEGEEKVNGCNVTADRSWTFGDADFAEFFTISSTDRWERHNYDYEFSLDGDTCSDGYEVNWTCLNEGCSARGSEYCKPDEGEHWTYELENYDLADYGFCDGSSIEVRGCPCGERTYQDTWFDGCSFECWWDDELEADVCVCETCGSSYTYRRTEQKLDGCFVQISRERIFYNKDGAEVLKLTSDSKEESHRMECSFELVGTTCDDGYSVTRTCKDCGYAWTDDGYYGHENWILERIDAIELGFCGGEIHRWGCACGQDDYWEYPLECQWTNEEDIDNGWTEECSECGILREVKYAGTQIDACHTSDTRTETFYKNGESIFSAVEEYIEEHHENIHSLTLMNPGTTCEEGVYIHSECTVCGEESDWETYHHARFLVEKVFVGKEGTCGTTIEKYSCGCGENTRFDRESMNCSFSYVDDNTSKCDYCGTTVEYTRTEQPKDENCLYDVIRTWKYYDADGNFVYECANVDKWEDHEYELTDYVMNDPSDCEAGVQVTRVCKDCNNMYVENYSHHAGWDKYSYNLADFGGCEGSRIWLISCFCGKHNDLNYDFYSTCNINSNYNTYYDEDGHRHDVQVWTCDECDLRFTRDEMYVRDAATCMTTRTSNVTIAVGSTAVASFSYENTYTEHDYDVTGALLPGSVDCEDGVTITHTCKDCNYTESSTEYYHRSYDMERYNLAELGAECGGEVVVRGCACGAERYINRDETLCDWDYDYDCESLVLGDSLSYQFGVDGYVSAYRWSGNYKCAVTDPTQCGFIIRICEYPVWDKANCVARRYITWQLGYDETTGTYAKEITIATGDSYAYHDYETTTSSSTAGTVTTDETTEVCNTCGSTHERIHTYDSSTETRREEDRATNLANNGRNKYYERISESRYFMGYYFELLYYNKIIFADDSESWTKSESIVDFANYNCEVLHRYSNSGGETSEWLEEKHINSWAWEYERTCSQYGNQIATCEVCGIVSGESQYSPYGHDWWYDDTTGMYHCYRCDLENINGADGEIIMEDLTDEHGNGTDYVVGYYNWDDVEFTYYVSLILSTGEEVIIDVPFEELDRDDDGIQAITFDKAEVTAAATAAGYTTYDVRFAFVPVGADGSLDYAITFTN